MQNIENIQKFMEIIAYTCRVFSYALGMSANVSISNVLHRMRGKKPTQLW